MPADPSLPADSSPPPKKRRVYKKPTQPRKKQRKSPKEYDAARKALIDNLDPEALARLMSEAMTAASKAPPPDLKAAAALRRLVLRTWDRKPR